MPKILIIDDSDLILRVMSHMVRDELGFEPVTAGSYGAAETLLVDYPNEFLAAVVDLNLPDATRGEAVDLVLRYKVPTIVLSANFDEEVRKTVLDKGVVDYLVKEGGFSYEYAIRIIRRLVENKQCPTLIVDDSATSRNMLKHLLTVDNLPVLEAENGVVALEVLKHNPDVCLMITDYNMPSMNGVELVRNVRKFRSYEELVIIGLSGAESDTVSARFIKMGANDFLRKPYSFEELQCRIMQNLETMEHVQTIRRSANQDYLTKLNNRRYFFEAGEKLIAAAKPKNQYVAVSIMDLDHFKMINDTYGHDAGDAVLVHMAELVRALPETILCARIGGEEFAMLFVGFTLPEIQNQLESFRIEIESSEVNHGGHCITFTLSIGVADQGGALDAMLKLADENLYQAKEAGRNQIIYSN